LFIAFVIRAAGIFMVSHTISSDEKDYLQLAHSIRMEQSYSSDGSPTAYRPPGYPAFIAVLMSIIPSATFVLIVQALLETLLCLLLYRTGTAAGGAAVGFTAMCIWAFFPSSILMPGLMMSETVLTVILFGALSAMLMMPKRMVLTGLLVGAGVLIKPQMAVPAAALTVWLAFRGEWKRSMLFAGTVLVLITPWLVRNAAVFGEPLLTTNGGVNFWIGNNPEANGSYRIPSNDPLDTIAGETARSDAGYRLGLEFIAAHPADALVLTGKKFAYLFSSQHYLVLMLQNSIMEGTSYRTAVRELPLRTLIMMNLPFVSIVLFACAGYFFIGKGDRSVRTMLAVLVVVWTGVHLVYFGAARFLYPLLPVLTLFAAAGFHHRRQFGSLLPNERVGAAAAALLFLSVLTAELFLTFR
jgi:hypothetical protein